MLLNATSGLHIMSGSHNMLAAGLTTFSYIGGQGLRIKWCDEEAPIPETSLDTVLFINTHLEPQCL